MKNPWAFALITVCVFAITLLPIAASRGLDVSAFIMAGDYFTTVGETPTPIMVLHHSLGYDGQFFYRFALNPFSHLRQAYGILLDSPAKRMQRIVYPLLAWFFSLGRPGLVPTSLVAINLGGLGIIAATATWLTQQRRLAWWFPFVILLWPGFLVALTHDTAEIVSAALLLGAIACYLSDRILAYCLLAAGAALTRETTIPVLLGVFAFESYGVATSPAPARRPIRSVLCGLVFVPFLAWWKTVALIWHQSPQSLDGNQDLGLPFLGWFTRLLVNLAGIRIGVAQPAADLPTRCFEVLVAGGLLVFCATVIRRIPEALRTQRSAGLAIGWVLTFALMTLLTADGPWIEAMSTFRAFSECWLIGCLLLALRPAGAPMRRPIIVAAAIAAVEVNVVIWKWSYFLLNN